MHLASPAKPGRTGCKKHEKVKLVKRGKKWKLLSMHLRWLGLHPTSPVSVPVSLEMFSSDPRNDSGPVSPHHIAGRHMDLAVVTALDEGHLKPLP